MTSQEFKNKVKNLAINKKCFFFMVDFEKKKPLVLTNEEINTSKILFKVGEYSNFQNPKNKKNKKITINKIPIKKSKYLKSFTKVQDHINRGDTYLLNLTFPSKITLNDNLENIFYKADSRYKILMKDTFVSFSPECFIQIKNNKVFSYPMKGTISSSVNNARNKIINDKKEIREHSTIVDLIRNDLAMLAKKIKVNKFRYVEEIFNNESSLLQVSSEIEGDLENNWQKDLGDFLWNVLPAGSVSGAPKDKTLEIIKSVELDERGYYSGIYGYFDGERLDSAVNIRYIENKDSNGFCFRSGGGITSNSKFEDEFDELIKKIYVPTI